ncbi:MAG: PilZ domain-containing protein [Elusimicrobiota bacterium]|jgi:hypothetical protein
MGLTLWPRTRAGGKAENRRDHRHFCDFKLSLLDGSRRSVPRPAFLTDMSRSGLGLRTDLPFSVGDKLGVQLALAGGRRIDASCTVRWTRSEGFLNSYGLEFEGLARRDRAGIASLLEPAPEVDRVGLFLQAGASIVLVLVFADLMAGSDAVRSSVVGALPYVLIFGGCLAGLWASFRS